VRADVVLVVGHDRLYQQLKGALLPTSPRVSVVKLPRSGGVSVRDGLLRRQLQARRVRDYFYGPQPPQPHAQLAAGGAHAGLPGGGSSGSGAGDSAAAFAPALKPHLLELPLAKCRLWQWRPDAAVDDDEGAGGLKPVTGKAGKASGGGSSGGSGSAEDEDEAVWLGGAVLERVEPSLAQLHCVAAVLHLPDAPVTHSSGSLRSYDGSSGQPMAVGGYENEEVDGEEALGQQLAGCSAAGFVVVQDVNLDKGTLTLLVPCPGKLPSTDLVLGHALKWVEG
jgi:hypothetical protein